MPRRDPSMRSGCPTSRAVRDVGLASTRCPTLYRARCEKGGPRGSSTHPASPIQKRQTSGSNHVRRTLLSAAFEVRVDLRITGLDIAHLKIKRKKRGVRSRRTFHLRQDGEYPRPKVSLFRLSFTLPPCHNSGD